MREFVGIAAFLIVALALCNPRLWKDLRAGVQGKRSSMDDVLDQGRADLKAAFRARRERERHNTD